MTDHAPIRDSKEYLMDECRNGFVITTAVKQSWLAELSVLSEIDRICKAHDLTYFADWGTLLGAVRHGGFVPWDDDLDICMRRADYDRFRRYAETELPPSFDIQDYGTHENHWLYITKIVNNHRISFEEDHLRRYHNFPYLANVDIFLLDNIDRNPKKEERRRKETLRILATADGIVDKSLSEGAVRGELGRINREYGELLSQQQRVDGTEERFLPLYLERIGHQIFQLPENAPDEECRQIAIRLYALAEFLMASVPEEDSDRIVTMFPWGLRGSAGYPKEWFERSIELPFEKGTIPVPVCYQKTLSAKYGNFLEIHKVWGGHDYPFFEGQRKNLEEVAGKEIPEFHFDPSLLRKNQEPEAIRSARSGSLKTLTRECISEFLRYQEEIRRLLSGKRKDDPMERVADLLISWQSLAIDLGNLIEKAKGEGTEEEKTLSDLCEAIYQMYQSFSPDQNAENSTVPNPGDPGEAEDRKTDAVFFALCSVADRTNAVLRRNLLERREVLFLRASGRARHGFDAFSPYIEKEKGTPLTDVTILELPVYEKDPLGRILPEEAEGVEKRDNGDESGDREEMSRDYSLSLHCPDTVYMDTLYDNENPSLTIPPAFYMRELQKYTDHLIYVCPFPTEDFDEESGPDLYNLRQYLLRPGAVAADELVCPSEKQREIWIRELKSFGLENPKVSARIDTCPQGLLESTKKNESGFRAESQSESQTNSRGKQKTLLFAIGLNRFTEGFRGGMERLEESLRTIRNSSDRIRTFSYFYPEEKKLWEEAAPGVWDETKRLLQKYGINEAEIQNNREKGTLSAYYGDPTPLVPVYISAKRPVMIARQE